ncbi:hypothetical protein Tco_1298521, partial [Tanacetum coccineum]
LSMIATKLGNSIMLDSLKSAISMESCGRSSVAHALIELKLHLKDAKQEDVEDDDFQSVKHKKSKDCNWDNQGKRQSSEFNKSTNGSYRLVVKPKSCTLVSNPFSALEGDNGNYE